MSRSSAGLRAPCWLTCLLPALVCAGPIEIPNHSFESPVTAFVSIDIDAWQKTERPDEYDESGGFLWSQLTGLFRNAPLGDPRRILNCDGDQAVWMFVVPGAGLWQESVGRVNGDPQPPTSLQARFEPGQGYRLTVGIIGGGGGMLPGATMEIALFYRDDAGSKALVGATTVTHDPALFTQPKELVDFSVQIAVVDSTDPWAGRHLGILLWSTVSPGLEGGYWELDNVRLRAFSAPRLVDFTKLEGGFRFGVESEPGRTLEVLSSSDLNRPSTEWAVEGTLSNETGRAEFTVPGNGADRRFYQVRQLP